MEDNIRQAVSNLTNGKAICFPTETVYALSVDAYNKEAVEKIYKIKGRDKNKPLALLLADLSMMEECVEVNALAKKIATAFMPGPITLILPKKTNNKLAGNINSGLKTIGVRIPDHAIALEIIRTFGHPVIGTSANISGMDAAISAEQIRNQLGNKVDFIFDNGESEIGVASTVVDLSEDDIKILRQGSVTLQEIKAVIND